MTHPPRPAPSLRAPIVWHDDRQPIEPETLLEVGPIIASARRRAAVAREIGEPEPRLDGQLWQRLAELEVATYGEPRL